MRWKKKEKKNTDIYPVCFWFRTWTWAHGLYEVLEFGLGQTVRKVRVGRSEVRVSNSNCIEHIVNFVDSNSVCWWLLQYFVWLSLRSKFVLHFFIFLTIWGRSQKNNTKCKAVSIKRLTQKEHNYYTFATTSFQLHTPLSHTPHPPSESVAVLVEKRRCGL